MLKEKFIQRVMQILNEQQWGDSEPDAFAGADITKVEEHICSVFRDAWRKAVSICPKWYFAVKDFSGSPLTGDFHTGCGFITLPDDFYTLAFFKMQGWKKSVEMAYSSNDSIYALQANEYTRGSFIRPVCILRDKVQPETGKVKLTLEYFSLPRGLDHIVEEALYIPLIPELDEVEEISEKLWTPLAYLTAALVLYVYEKVEMAQVLEAQASLVQ